MQAALGRVLAEEIVALEPLPPFNRSARDGYGVRAADTVGSSETAQVHLRVVGEVAMGEPPGNISLEPGQAVVISTGGALPEGADAVVMFEHAGPAGGQTVAIRRPARPGENLIATGADFPAGNVVLSRGALLRPQDLGVLAALGITAVAAVRRPRVGILATGDELVSAHQPVPPGRIREINSTIMTALAEEAGAVALAFGICGDDPLRLVERCRSSLSECDLLLLSGGSSRGRRDFTLQVIEDLPDIHIISRGIAARNGKPTIIGRQGGKFVFGLPGPTAALVTIFYLLVRPLLRRLSGLTADPGLVPIRAVMAQSVRSSPDREEVIRVSLSMQGDQPLPLAAPNPGPSGLLSPLVESDGLLLVSPETEVLAAGSECTVLLFPHTVFPLRRQQAAA